MAQGIFVGLSTFDVVYRVNRFPTPNTKVAAQSQDVSVGGPATNAAIAFAHLGGKTTLVTAVGRHALGEVVRKDLHTNSVQLLDLNPGFDEAPAISSVTVNATGERNVVSANAIRIPAPAVRWIEGLLEHAQDCPGGRAFYAACQAWAAAAHARGICVVLDGGSWKDGTADLLANVDMAICSADFKPPGCGKGDKTIQYLKDRGVKHVAITHGGEPVRFESGSSQGTLRVPEVEAVDTMGAGDIFHGAFCHYACTGHGFVESLAEAAQIASESCRYHGTREWMKHTMADALP